MNPSAPLADRLRPQSFDEVVGQENLLGTNGLLPQLIRAGRPMSLLFWGPPGCGKTTLARLYARAFDARFVAMSAVFTGVAELKKLVCDIKSAPLFTRQTLVFVDEIHRFNKAQQDAFLPYIEDGTFILVGATTENPSFALNGALLSRLRVVTLKALDDYALEALLKRYEGQHSPLPLTPEARAYLRSAAQGDGRYLLNLVETIQSSSEQKMRDVDDVTQFLQRRAPLMDRAGDNHYNLISALHKSVRGSDPDAALYYLSRLLVAGEDPLFISRRLIRAASEDIGLADPLALTQAIAARDAYQMLGSPEGDLALAQATVYLALAPKSNALYTALGEAKEDAAASSQLPPPATILNAPTQLMKQLGYGKDYQYDHDSEHGFSGQNYFPDDLGRKEYYHPVERGFEREMVKRQAYFTRLRGERTTSH